MKMFQKIGILAIALMALLAWNVPAMAADYTSTQAGLHNIHQARYNGEGAMAFGTYAIPVAATANDVYQMVKIPAGVTVTDVMLASEDLDTGTAIVLDVGYGGDVDYFIDGSTVGQAGGIARAAAVTALPLAFTAADTIDVKLITTAGTAAAGSITLTVWYTGSP